MELVSRLAGVQIHNPMDEVFFTQQGVQPSAIDSLKQLGMSTGDLVWIIKPRTLSHRKVNHEKLTQDETGRWLRAAKIHALAIVVFGDPDKASRWLHSPRKQFGGMTAATLIQTEAGVQLVEETLGQLDSGYFA